VYQHKQQESGFEWLSERGKGALVEQWGGGVGVNNGVKIHMTGGD
jgi:hypothetical protein